MFEIRIVADYVVDPEGGFRPQITLFYDGRMSHHWLSTGIFNDPDHADEHAKDLLLSAEESLLKTLEYRPDLKESEVT